MILPTEKVTLWLARLVRKKVIQKQATQELGIVDESLYNLQTQTNRPRTLRRFEICSFWNLGYWKPETNTKGYFFEFFTDSYHQEPPLAT